MENDPLSARLYRILISQRFRYNLRWQLTAELDSVDGSGVISGAINASTLFPRMALVCDETVSEVMCAAGCCLLKNGDFERLIGFIDGGGSCI